MTLRRKDLDDGNDPNPNAGEPYQQPELRESRIPDRAMADVNWAADQRRQAEERLTAPAERGHRTNDVQLSDRSEQSSLGEEGDGESDTSARVNEARTRRDDERESRGRE